MLTDKVKALHESIEPLKQAYAAIELVKPIKEEIEKACEKLKVILDGVKVGTIDEEIKNALVSVYGILEAANMGLKEERVAGLFA